MTSRRVRLADAAELNPGLGAKLAREEVVSFVPMSGVSAEGASTLAEERLYYEVCKGYTTFVQDDLLVAKITPCFENGKIAQARLPYPIGFGSTEFHVIRPRAGLDARYLLHFLRQDRVLRDGALKMTGSGGQRRVPEHFLAQLELHLPPLPEQRRLAELLDRTDALRRKRREAITQLDTLPQALFAQRFGDPFQNPHGFTVKPLMDVVDPQRPICYGILMPGPDQKEGVKYIRVVDMKDGGVELSGVRKTTPEISSEFRRSLLRPGDLLLSIRGHVGRLATVPPELEGANITQDTARLATGSESSLFFRECLRTPSIQRWMQRYTKGAAVRGINLGDVKKMPVIVPPTNEQKRFSDAVLSMEKARVSQQASLIELDALFHSLQHRAFHGTL